MERLRVREIDDDEGRPAGADRVPRQWVGGDLAAGADGDTAALRYFALDRTDHATHQEQASMIRRYTIWRNSHAYDERLLRVLARANVA
jgi:hypothetical protein